MGERRSRATASYSCKLSGSSVVSSIVANVVSWPHPCGVGAGNVAIATLALVYPAESGRLSPCSCTLSPYRVRYRQAGDFRSSVGSEGIETTDATLARPDRGRG